MSRAVSKYVTAIYRGATRRVTTVELCLMHIQKMGTQYMPQRMLSSPSPCFIEYLRLLEAIDQNLAI